MCCISSGYEAGANIEMGMMLWDTLAWFKYTDAHSTRKHARTHTHTHARTDTHTYIHVHTHSKSLTCHKSVKGWTAPSISHRESHQRSLTARCGPCPSYEWWLSSEVDRIGQNETMNNWDLSLSPSLSLSLSLALSFSLSLTFPPLPFSSLPSRGCPASSVWEGDVRKR